MGTFVKLNSCRLKIKFFVCKFLCLGSYNFFFIKDLGFSYYKKYFFLCQQVCMIRGSKVLVMDPDDYLYFGSAVILSAYNATIEK